MAATVERAIVITGSASRIGAVMARRLPGPGTAILVHARENARGVAEVRCELEAKGTITEGLCADLAESDAADRIIDHSLGAFGRIDALIHVAGFPVLGGFKADEASAAECFAAIP